MDDNKMQKRFNVLIQHQQIVLQIEMKIFIL